MDQELTRKEKMRAMDMQVFQEAERKKKKAKAQAKKLEVSEERRGFYFDGGTFWLTLTELQGRLSGTPTKHLLAVWEDGAKLITWESEAKKTKVLKEEAEV